MDIIREGLQRLGEFLANLNVKHVLIASGVLVALLAFWRSLPGWLVRPSRRFALIDNTQVALVILILIFLLIRPHFFQAFFIPSGSMIPTFQQNDRLLVNKLIYRFAEPKRGEIVVFMAPPSAQEAETEFIKRVAALPHDYVEIVGTRLLADDRPVIHFYQRVTHLGSEAGGTVAGLQVWDPDIELGDGEVTIDLGGYGNEKSTVILAPLAEVRTEDYDEVRVGGRTFTPWEPGDWFVEVEDPTAWGAAPDLPVRMFSTVDQSQVPALIVVDAERLELEDPHLRVNGRKVEEPYLHETMNSVMPPVQVPAGAYLMLGDNRNDSSDSRAWGFLDGRRILGRAEITFWPPHRIRVLEWWLILFLTLVCLLYMGLRHLLAPRVEGEDRETERRGDGETVRAGEVEREPALSAAVPTGTGAASAGEPESEREREAEREPDRADG